MSDLVSVHVLEDVNAAGMFTFTLLSWDNKEMRVIWIDDDQFKEGNTVEIDMGYRDNMKTLFKGEITGVEPEFPKDQPPTLTVRGYDRRHRLMATTQDADVFEDAGQRDRRPDRWRLESDAGLTEDSRVTHDYVLQHNQSDFEFLPERARRIGYEMVVTDTHPSLPAEEERRRARCSRSIGKSSSSISMRWLTTMGQVEEVYVQGWSAKDKDGVVAKSAVGRRATDGRDGVRAGGDAASVRGDRRHHGRRCRCRARPRRTSWRGAGSARWR